MYYFIRTYELIFMFLTKLQNIYFQCLSIHFKSMQNWLMCVIKKNLNCFSRELKSRSRDPLIITWKTLVLILMYFAVQSSSLFKHIGSLRFIYKTNTKLNNLRPSLPKNFLNFFVFLYVLLRYRFTFDVIVFRLYLIIFLKTILF